MLAELYDTPYDHTKWDEHKERVQWTAQRLNHFITLQRPNIYDVVDLSCGDGALLNMLDLGADGRKTYGDLVWTPTLDVIGPIEESVKSMSGDMLICSETLEHLDDPDQVLRDACTNFEWIVITTPLGEDDQEKNYEHYWGWDILGVAAMLQSTGWSARVLETIKLPYYTYQLWIAKRLG